MKTKVKNLSRICLVISGAIMLVALVLSLLGHGVNLGLDFTGGLNITYNMNTAFASGDVEDALRAQGVTQYSVSASGDDRSTLQIRIAQLGGEDKVQSLQAALETELLKKYPQMDVTTATASYVGPVAGATLVKNAVWSVLIAMGLMLVYIAIRFDVCSGLAAVFGLVHDVLIMFSFMVLLRSVVQMNSSFIAAMLTIVGYSINNTIVIFDRIRENNRNPSFSSLSREEVVNLSISESLGRTINTTLTTLVTITTLYVLGVASIREFSLPIIVGILSGVYSANMINGYVWAFLAERRKSARQKTLVAKQQ